VDFVDDVDFKITARWCEADIISKLPNLVDAVVAGTVDFEHVEADTLGNLPTRVADSARIDGRTMNAVQRLGQDPGRRRFTSSARADKKVGVSNTLLLNCIFQRLNDVILAENVVEYLGPIFSGEDLVTHADNVVSCPRRGQDLKVLRFEFWVIAHPRTFNTQNSKPKTQNYSRLVRYFRLLLWFGFFAIATFCWVVIIEHGPENFIEGAKIEIENLGWVPFHFFKKAAPAESTNQADRAGSLRGSAR
jgi:hypothetical protein